MQRNNYYEFDVVCLGTYGITAAWRRHKEDAERRYMPALTITQCSATDDGVFVPACDITITTTAGLIALRNAIDEALKYDMPKQADA